MDNPVLPPVRDGIARAYMKRLRITNQFLFFLPLVFVWIYSYLDLDAQVIHLAHQLTNNFYLQLAICWLPAWFVMAIATFMVLYYRLRLERQFGLSNSTLTGWAIDSTKAVGLGLFVGFAVIEVAFGMAKVSAARGWMLAGAFYSVLFLGVNSILPWILALFYPVIPLTGALLHERIIGLARKAGLPIKSIQEWCVSSRTRKANALVAGIGPWRRVLLTDTMVQNFSVAEVEAILGHEFGHCAHHHLSKRILLRSAGFCAIFWIIFGAVGNKIAIFAPANISWSDLRFVPGFYILWRFGNIYSSLIIAALARKQEKEADQYCWELIGNVEPFISAMKKLMNLNLIVYEKKEQWKYSHPATSQRIAAAEQFAKLQNEVNQKESEIAKSAAITS